MKWSSLSRQKSGIFKLPFSNKLLHVITRYFGKSPFMSPKGFFQNISARPPLFFLREPFLCSGQPAMISHSNTLQQASHSPGLDEAAAYCTASNTGQSLALPGIPTHTHADRPPPASTNAITAQ